MKELRLNGSDNRTLHTLGTDLLPDLANVMSLTPGLKRALLHTPSNDKTKEEIAAEWLRREEERKKSRDSRKVSWECPVCGEVLPNATYKITNGRHKGLTMKSKHKEICMSIRQEIKEDGKSDVSSTEERVRVGEIKKERLKMSLERRCPYSGCGKVYKNAYAVGFRNHVKSCSFKNQRELGCWVIKSARKYDHDLLEN